MLEQLPPEFQRFDEPLLPYGKAIIIATQDLVRGYLLDFPAYLTTGAAGMIALERTLAFASVLNLITILDGSFASSTYAPAFSHGELKIDAVTVNEASLCAEFENAGVAAIVKGENAVQGQMTFANGQICSQNDCWQILSVDQIIRGSENPMQRLREYTLSLEG